MANYYVKNNSVTYSSADLSIHAGITKDLIQGNTLACYENSFTDYSNFLSFAEVCTPANEWDVLSEWIPLPLPCYKSTNGGYRPWTINLFVKTTTAAATLRVVLSHIGGVGSLWFPADTGIPVLGTYDDIDVTNSQTWKSVTLYPEDTTEAGTCPIVYVCLGAGVTSAGDTITINGIHCRLGE